MNENENDGSTKQIPIKNIKFDPAAEDLLDSAAMEPYMNLAIVPVQREMETRRFPLV